MDTTQHAGPPSGRHTEPIADLLAALETADPAEAPAISDDLTRALGDQLDLTAGDHA